VTASGTNTALRDIRVVAARALRLLPLDKAEYIPPFIAGLFTYVITVGALQDVASFTDIGMSYEAFQLPVGVLFAITGLSRAYSLVTDIQGGYFERLVMSPVRRSAILVGLMVADAVLVGTLAGLMVILGLVIGVDFDTGVAGMAVFVLLCAAWGLAFAGIPYTIALRTGNPGAVAGSWVMAFPFLLLTTTFVPRDAMAGWLSAVAAWNPATYLLAALRSLFLGWDGTALLHGALAVAAVGVVAMSLAASALRARTRSH
jgi:ABC-2 type transport system permease protein